MGFRAFIQAGMGQYHVTAQQEFDDKYITSSEVCEQLGIHRSTVLLAVRAQRLPTPIVAKRPNGLPIIMMWIRGEVQATLDDWKDALHVRKGA